jgi:hypothetical protein
MKSATAATITKITNMATTAALLPPPLLSAIEIHPPLFVHDSHLAGDVSVFGAPAAQGRSMKEEGSLLRQPAFA